jgi:hypothetical protein
MEMERALAVGKSRFRVYGSRLLRPTASLVITVKPARSISIDGVRSDR